MSTPKLQVKTGDTVVVISGVNKGKSGKITRAYPKDGTVVVEHVNIVKKHQKPRGQGMPGGIIEKEAAIPACKTMLICPACKKATRIAHAFVKNDEGKLVKQRVCRKCGQSIDD
jgi:large subunit ribosomal protein L24